MMQFIHVPNCTPLSKKILYQYCVIFFTLLRIASPLKTSYISLHSANNLKKIETTSGSLHYVSEITHPAYNFLKVYIRL